MTLLVDLIWIAYWGPLWNSASLAEWDKGIHTVVLLCSGINIFLKIAILLCYFVSDRDTLQSTFKTSIGQFIRF